MKTLKMSHIVPYSFVAALLSPVGVLAQSGPQPSIFDSYELYLGVVAILGLVGLAAFLRKKNQEDPASKPVSKANDGLRMTYREKPEKAPEPKPAVEQKPEKPAGPQVCSFKRLQRTNPYIQLPESLDPALLQAIEKTNEESEEDVQERTQALKLLSTFRNSNSVGAVAQMALYDLSSKLRSDAVGVLAEFDHESVFEPIVTACADPTREVRAAAARALFKLSFDRGHSWTRIIESGNITRMRHAARCAIEGDLVQRSFDRLTHPDTNVSYEAFALAALLVRSGETELIFKALAEHKDELVKLSLLNVLQVMKDESSLEELGSLIDKNALTPKVAEKANEVRSSLQMAHA